MSIGAETRRKRWHAKALLPLGGIVIVAIVYIVSVSARTPDTTPPGTGARTELTKQTRFIMGTYVTIRAAGPREEALPAINRALDRMEQVDRKFNPNKATSPLLVFNTSGTPVTDQEIVELAGTALQISRKTDGAFDMTISPLTELWGFSGDAPHLPRKGEIAECLAKVGYQRLVIADGTLQSDGAPLGIDMGAIAKGYAIAQAAEVLKQQGVTSAIIDAGGDIYALGLRDGRPWKVGIRHPRKEGLLGYVEVQDMAVMGSGDYERFFIQDGTRYHHILDPKTGYPATELSSATIIYSDPVIADAWATALFVKGPVDGLALAEEMPGMEAIMVTVSGDVRSSSGLGKNLKPIPDAE